MRKKDEIVNDRADRAKELRELNERVRVPGGQTEEARLSTRIQIREIRLLKPLSLNSMKLMRT